MHPCVCRATCDKGKCVMAEEDFKRLQDFHQQVRKHLEAVRNEQDMNTKSIMRLMNELAKCNARQPEREL